MIDLFYPPTPPKVDKVSVSHIVMREYVPQMRRKKQSREDYLTAERTRNQLRKGRMEIKAQMKKKGKV